MIKIPDTIGLVTTTVLKIKIDEAENKAPNVSGLVKKSNYDAKISDIKGRCFTIADYNIFASDILDSKLKPKELLKKYDISNLVKDSDLSTKFSTLTAKAVLKVEQDNIGKFKRLIQSIFIMEIFSVMMFF